MSNQTSSETPLHEKTDPKTSTTADNNDEKANFDGVGNRESQGSQSMNELKDYATHHKKEAIAAAIALVGVVLSYFYLMVGGGLVGIVTGFFLGNEIKKAGKKLFESFNTQDKFKSVLIGALLLCAFLANPWLFLGMVTGFGIQTLLQSFNEEG